LSADIGMRTFVYIDAFNLYYGAVKDTAYKWLDLAALCRLLLPPRLHHIVKIKYFTARVQPRPNDPDQPMRQQIYLRALRTLPHCEIIYGHYLSHAVFMPLANPPPGQNPYVRVIKSEEKGSDVNLATHLLFDAFRDCFECAVVVSGDSDLKTPVALLRSELKKPVGVINPQRKVCRALQQEATFYKHIRESALQSSQFPAAMTDANGTFTKPASW